MLKKMITLKKGKKRKLEIDENDKENSQNRRHKIVCLDSPETRKYDVPPTLHNNVRKKHKSARVSQIVASAALVTPDAPNRKKLPPSARKLLHQEELQRKLTPFTKKQAAFEKQITSKYTYIPPVFRNVICIEGNIGSGKSTLLKQLESEFTVIQEPVATVWAKYLPLLYGDSKRWGMTFQMEALHWFNKLRTQILPELGEQKVIIVERSPQSSTKIFARNMKENSIITEWEHDVIARFFKAIEWKPCSSIYLQLDADTCVKRIRERAREGEEGIERKLVQELNKYHDEVWAENKDPEIEVSCIDASLPIEEVARQAKSIIMAKFLEVQDCQ